LSPGPETDVPGSPTIVETCPLGRTRSPPNGAMRWAGGYVACPRGQARCTNRTQNSGLLRWHKRGYAEKASGGRTPAAHPAVPTHAPRESAGGAPKLRSQRWRTCVHRPDMLGRMRRLSRATRVRCGRCPAAEGAGTRRPACGETSCRLSSLPRAE
jgi:hypothetical protein